MSRNVGAIRNRLLDRWFHHNPINIYGDEAEMTVGSFYIDPNLTTDIHLDHFVTVLLVIGVTVVLVGVYPAIRAASGDPVSALHET